VFVEELGFDGSLFRLMMGGGLSLIILGVSIGTTVLDALGCALFALGLIALLLRALK
jgi:hypothetical protein